MQNCSFFVVEVKVCFLKSFQRILIRFFFAEPPKSSYEEAYNYFLKAEEIKGKFYIPNIYMLGNFFNALKVASNAMYFFF